METADGGLRRTSVARRLPVLLALAACGGGGGDGGPQVGVVTITAPAAPPSFQTLGRTAQFTAAVTDAAGAPLGIAVTWSSSNIAVATISGSGLASAAGNGTTQIRASAGGVQSAPVTVTVQQVVDHIAVTPASLAFGALGSAKQLVAVAVDSGGAGVPGASLPAFTHAGGGAATVTAGGLVTSVAVGNTDTAVIGATRVPISVQQLVATVAVTSAGITPDTLFASGRTRQFNASPRDSNNNVVPGGGVSWASLAPGVATVDGNGLVTAVGDGSAPIQATVLSATGQRSLVVRRLAASHSVTPPTATISVSGGTQGFTGAAADSTGTALPLTWTSRDANLVTVSPSVGGSTTATAVFNGTTRIVLSVPSGPVDSATITLTGQPLAAATASVQVGDNFFRSVRNNTTNLARDTVRVGGQVTWTWLANVVQPHNVQSSDFPSSANLAAGQSFQATFNSAGTFAYTCNQHPNMTGEIVVR